MRRRRALALIAAAALLAGCSATKLAYNNLDALVSWQVGKFIDLTDANEESFNTAFRGLWDWHRRTQLPLYVADLRELAQAVQSPMTVAQIEGYRARAQAHADRLVVQGLPDATRLLAQLDDRQVADLSQRLDKRRAERAAEQLAKREAKAREQAGERMLDSLKRWLGSVTAAQKASVAAWTTTLLLDPAAEVAARQDWGARFNALLRDRRQPDFEARLTALLDGKEYRQKYESLDAIYRHNEAAALGLLAELSQGLSPKQRRHLAEELEDLALDLEQLTAVSQP